MNAPDKPKFPASDALAVAQQIERAIQWTCERVTLAGSLRRRKPTVGDVEILYIPTLVKDHAPQDFFQADTVSATDHTAITMLINNGILAKRKNIKGQEMFGEKNKLMVHVATGIPVDLFSATQENWWNYLVCRTGGAQNNVQIAAAARDHGWKWNPYGPGFSRRRGGEDIIEKVTSERHVFEFVKLPYREPWERL